MIRRIPSKHNADSQNEEATSEETPEGGHRHTGQKDSLLNPVRGQTREDGYATIEALAYLFQEMQAPKEVCDEFLRQLKVSIDHCRIQNGKDPVYDKDFAPEVGLQESRLAV